MATRRCGYPVLWLPGAVANRIAGPNYAKIALWSHGLNGVEESLEILLVHYGMSFKERVGEQNTSEYGLVFVIHNDNVQPLRLFVCKQAKN